MERRSHRTLLALVLACALALAAAVCAWLVIRLFKRRRADDGHDDGPLDLRVVDGFLAPDECSAVQRAALAKGLTRSTVLRVTGPSATRTSSTVFLSEDDDPVVGTVLGKVSALLGASRDRFEQLQVIRYEPGQEYREHYDPCFKCREGGGDMLREWSVVMYLNDDFEGGATEFPRAPASVTPAKGSAAVFRSMRDGRIVRASQHRSVPVVRGTKWAATVWVRPE